MKLKAGPLRFILTFGCGLLWNVIPAKSVPLWSRIGELAVENNVNSRSYRDVGAAIWPMTWKVDYENPGDTTRSRSVRTPESMTEAVIMIDDFWRTLANNAETEDQHNFEDEMEEVMESTFTDKKEEEETNHETESDEKITSRFSDDSYQEISSDILQPPQQHLSLYPPYLPGYAPRYNFHGDYLLRPPPPTMHSGPVPLTPYYGNSVVPGDISVPNQDPELDMEFHGNRAHIGVAPVAYPRSMSHHSQYTSQSQYPPIPAQLMLNYYMVNAANFQNPYMNSGAPQSPPIGYSGPVGPSIPQPSYPFLGMSSGSLPGVSTYPYHKEK